MKELHNGQFYGQTNQTIYLDGLTLTDTEYTHPKVDWHYHELPYFTFIIEGRVIEGNKKDVYHCAPGSLLFHNWQEAHYNIKPPGYTRGFHIELKPEWLNQYELSLGNLTGSISLLHPDHKLLFYSLFRESKITDETRTLSVHSRLLELFALMGHEKHKTYRTPPEWVKQVRESLHDNFASTLTLSALSASLGIHPVHLSRDFSKYFQCNLGEYIRKLRIEKSLSLLASTENSLSEIAYLCGFSDQSHFIRCFKAVNHVKPSEYRKTISS